MLLTDHGVFRLVYLNRHRVCERLWRSAQPAPHQIAWFAAQGVNTIVNLRGAREHGWRIGVIEATPVLHSLRPVGTSYRHMAAVEEARAFLGERPYVPATEAQRTFVEHRAWP